MKVTEKTTKKQLIEYANKLVAQIEGIEQEYSKYYVIWEDGEATPCNDKAEVEKVLGGTTLSDVLDKTNVIIKGKQVELHLSIEQAA